MGGDFGGIFANFDEGIFFHIPKEKFAKSTQKIPQIFSPTLRIDSRVMIPQFGLCNKKFLDLFVDILYVSLQKMEGNVKVQQLTDVVSGGTQVESPKGLHNNHWFEQICPGNAMSGCFAKVKQCFLRLYGPPYQSLTRGEVITNYCCAGVGITCGLAMITLPTIVATTPPIYASDPQNMPPYASIPMAIILYSAGVISVIGSVVTIYKTCVAPRVGELRPLLS